MCGRYVIDENDDIADMRRIFEKLKKYYNDTVEYQNVKKGEIFPSDTAPIIIPEKETNIDAVPMQWGFKTYNDKLVINARCEGIYERPLFKKAIVNKRCVIPANGFFEWARPQNGLKKEKYLIKPTEAPVMYFAGIYDTFTDPQTNKDQIRFVIITKEARGLIRSLHDRMPVVVARRDMLKWLNGNLNYVNEFFADNNPPEYTFTNLGIAG
ncbi:MAG: SOS response-associated peptidase [Oscillospiraceae bacterium]|nr:SOS response-associated peptidase [Oscillospiraceae bacterium]